MLLPVYQAFLLFIPVDGLTEMRVLATLKNVQFSTRIMMNGIFLTDVSMADAAQHRTSASAAA